MTEENLDAGRAGQEILLAIHQQLRQELARLQDVIVGVREGRSTASEARYLNTMTMRQNYWRLGAFCAAYCRVVSVHHAIEDQQLFRDLEDADASLGVVGLLTGSSWTKTQTAVDHLADAFARPPEVRGRAPARTNRPAGNPELAGRSRSRRVKRDLGDVPSYECSRNKYDTKDEGVQLPPIPGTFASISSLVVAHGVSEIDGRLNKGREVRMPQRTGC